MVDELRIRQAARAVVMDPRRSVLLVHFDFPVPLGPAMPDDAADPPMWAGGLWACPGGGIDAGESVVDGLRRELREELGLVVDQVGEPIWVKEHHFPMTRWDGQHDTYFLVEVGHPFEPRPAMSDAELRSEHVDAVRWWTYDDLMRAQHAYDAGAVDDGSFAVFSPRLLGHLLTELVEDGRPAEPRVVGPR